MWLLLLFACLGGVRSVYDLEKTTVLRSPDPVQSDWTGQIRVRLGSTALSRIARRAVTNGILHWQEKVVFAPPLMPAVTLIPSLKVTNLYTRLDENCSACLYINAKLSGAARVVAGPISGEVPFSARVRAIISVQVIPTDTAWKVIGDVESIEDIEISALDGWAAASIGPLRKWVSEAVKKMPPFVLGKVGGAKLPIRAARLHSDGRALELSVITSVADAVPIGPANRSVDGDWDVRLHPTTLAAILRYGGHLKGPGKHGIIDVPTALRVTEDTFELDIRLWRMVGSGWWRDFTVHGQVQVDGDELKLIPTESKPVAKSRNAGWVDPIFAIAERKTLTGVTNGVRRALPASTDANLGKMSLTPRITELYGNDDEIILQGEIH